MKPATVERPTNWLEKIPELAELENLFKAPFVRHKLEQTIYFGGGSLPVYSIEIGSTDPKAPCLFLTAGVHGLERIGSEILISWLASLIDKISWDTHLADFFKTNRIVAVPIVNPSGMYLSKRSNARGVDLMRNSPIESHDSPPYLLGGHRISKFLPWYRGEQVMGAKPQMEPELSALEAVYDLRVRQSDFCISLDLHSGFGMKDRLWFPYATENKASPDLPYYFEIKNRLDKTNPYHIYQVEPQAHAYIIHGDFWDYIYKKSGHEGTGKFIPWTLELGSWMWLKKNPKQLFSLTGFFNPILPHRRHRIFRRHVPLLDFFLKVVGSHDTFFGELKKNIETVRSQAFDSWYKDKHS